jgi:segregation and condensation protein B
MRELSKSAVETLAIILYGENVSKGDIDFIRGVNSGFILRNLSVRGLIEKLVDENDGRKYIYRPTLELMQSLGITSPADLENREEIKNSLLGRVVEHNKQTEEEQ